jgi:hypothetical protein
MHLRLSRNTCPDRRGRGGAGPGGVEPPAAGFGDRGAAVARACGGYPRMTWCAGWEIRRWWVGGGDRYPLPALDGFARQGEVPSPRLLLVIERAGSARRRAEARQGKPQEHQFGGAVACHRVVDFAPHRRPGQPLFEITPWLPVEVDGALVDLHPYRLARDLPPSRTPRQPIRGPPDRPIGDALTGVWAARSGTLSTWPVSVLERVCACAAPIPVAP